MIPVFIGYDYREPVAYHVCSNSIITHSKQPVSLIPLALNLIPGYTEQHQDGSNDFVYTRFLVPQLMDYQGWAIFIDGDMVVRDDISQLWNLRDDSMDVMVVQHDYQTRSSTKYLGSKNENYPRKNWSSVILWNCGSLAHRCLTSEFVERAPGSYLHRFAWLQDSRIGSLPLEWNWLPDEYGANDHAKLLHYTLGTPCFPEFADVPQAREWHQQKSQTMYCGQDPINHTSKSHQK